MFEVTVHYRYPDYIIVFDHCSKTAVDLDWKSVNRRKIILLKSCQRSPIQASQIE